QVREQYGLAPDENFRLSDYPTIETLAGWLASQLGSATAAPAAPVASESPAPAPAPEPAAAAPAVSSDVDVLGDLLSVISEKTGYSVDELDPEFELEADLGIDTVKQAEIFGQVREQYGLAPDENFRLSDYPTIETLAGWLAGQLSGAANSAAPAAEESAVPAVSEEASVIEPTPAPDPEPEPPAPPEEPAVNEGFGENGLPGSFRLRRPVWVSRMPWSMGSIKGRVVRVLGEGVFADALRTAILSKGASTEGIPDSVIDAGADVLDSFALAQSLDGAHPRDWISANHGGDVAETASHGLVSGARAGFAKAIDREWQDCAGRVVNVSTAMDVDTAAALVIEELGAPDGSVEIAWNSEGRRAIELAVVPFPEVGASLPGTPVIVLTGGTRGITAEVALAFAERGPCKLALLARTAPGEAALDEAKAKKEAKAAIEAAGERATPAKVRDRVAPLKRAEEARLNVAKMRSLGAEVAFFAVDLSSPDEVRACLDAVRDSMGAISGLVHGAGVEESRLIADKDAKAFHRVFDGKALGGLAIAESLESDAWLVSMGSVAGRFGNPGQVDYSAANEAMAQVCISRPKSLHIDWTAWADVGMAVRGGMDKLLSDRGVEMLPAHGGSRLVVDMVVNGFSGELMVAGKLGDFGINPTHPLIDAVEMDGDTIVARRDLSLQSDPWIVDHAIDGKPVLPGVIGLELMAATAAMADPGHVYAGAKDVEFLAPVKLHGDAITTVFVRATPTDSGVDCTLSSERSTRTGRTISTDHFSATICWDMTKQSPLPAMGMPDHPITAEEIYQRFFHGPGFQVLSSASACTADALLADGSVRHTSIAGGLITDPLVLEAAFQAAGLHRMMVDNVMALPQRIASVSTLSSVRDDQAIRLTARRDGNAYDVDVVCDGGLSLALRGFEMVQAGPLPPGKTFEPPKGGWTPAVIARVKAKGTKGPKAYSTLTEKERASIGSRGTPKRQADRLLGRLAAKRAVSQLTGLDPLSFEIENSETGEPYVQSANGDAMPRISISHRSGEAIAVATNTGRAGIDLELVEARDPSFAETWFRPSERQLCSGDPRQESTVWAVKEAVLKALGAGMRLDPREVEVLSIRDGHAEVRLWGEVLSRHAALGAGSLTVDIEDDQAMVIAVAWMAS
ncbi:MAG: hypothetical protein CL930_08260, partial [Deltaproteobacteria bacterium]|nr:hypothetical protein [Deltaproteobacteria bacterium]